MERRPLALASVVVGALLVASAVGLFPHAGEAECANEVERVDRADVPDSTEVRQYGELSGDAKRAFDRARTERSGKATVYGERCPEAFTYADYTQRNYVRYDGDVYELQTWGGGGFLPTGLLTAGGLALLGLVVAAVGGASLVDDGARSPIGLVVAGLAMVALGVATGGSATLLPLTTVVVVGSFVGVGLLLSPQWALAVGTAASALAAVGIVDAGWNGPAYLAAAAALAFVVAGIVVRLATGRLREGTERTGNAET